MTRNSELQTNGGLELVEMPRGWCAGTANYSMVGIVDDCLQWGVSADDGSFTGFAMGPSIRLPSRERCYYCESFLAVDTLQCPHCGGSKRYE